MPCARPAFSSAEEFLAASKTAACSIEGDQNAEIAEAESEEGGQK